MALYNRGYWLWRYITEDEMRQQGDNANPLNPLRNNPSDNGVAPHDEAIPARGSNPSDKEFIEPLTKPPLEPLAGTPIDRDGEATDDPEFRKGFNDVRVSQENEADPVDDDMLEVE